MIGNGRPCVFRVGGVAARFLSYSSTPLRWPPYYPEFLILGNVAFSTPGDAACAINRLRPDTSPRNIANFLRNASLPRGGELTFQKKKLSPSPGKGGVNLSWRDERRFNKVRGIDPSLRNEVSPGNTTNPASAQAVLRLNWRGPKRFRRSIFSDRATAFSAAYAHRFPTGMRAT